ncbi:TetR family transcriptional regulator C-terminal domain-containing protein [Flavobacteriaceae bacterium]|nr:TetR family transcriptional regulator C-terminal domain-containing protein [Flavobacteriaceae bacterium]MDC1469798.1 TetR family transcriptional regulator C-terminal domain-containing protein [Flavobacteriaceae bacterium]
MAKKIPLSQNTIVQLYMNYVLEHNHPPKSIYTFSKSNGFEEADFYQFFANFEVLESAIFSLFFTNTLNTLETSKDYPTYDSRNQLLSFYFTFFENLTANRSYVVYALNESSNQLENLKKLKGLRSKFLNYIDQLDIEVLQIKNKQLEQIKDSVVQETYWIQLMLTLKFWLDDTSTSFEKTDIFIEKSINASFDLINISPLKSFVDFGKFLIKEKISMN